MLFLFSKQLLAALKPLQNEEGCIGQAGGKKRKGEEVMCEWGGRWKEGGGGEEEKRDIDWLTHLLVLTLSFLYKKQRNAQFT